MNPAGNFFENFRVGETFRHATPRTVTEGDASLYIGLTGSRVPLHCSSPFGRSLGYRGHTIDDLLAFNIAFGKTVPDVSLNAVANLGYAEARFAEPVYAGDTLRVESTVIGLKQNSNGKSGVVWVRSHAYNQHKSEVMSWVRWVMVAKADSAAVAPETVVPELAPAVKAADLAIPPGLVLQEYDRAAAGGSRWWEDYAEGERIDHPAGMTVEDAEHTLATRLYQNSARVHFDALAMKESQFGRRLMYGGHVISVCRALAFDGLENALSIAAINAGTHCNPSFGGDTFYAQTRVLERWPLPGRNDLGALRLRMLGIRNLASAKLDEPQSESGGKPHYHPSVVLDLDYTVLMPRKPRLN
ncbi:MAG: MaoC family dehydratase [Rhodospirillales bacterium]